MKIIENLELATDILMPMIIWLFMVLIIYAVVRLLDKIIK